MTRPSGVSVSLDSTLTWLQRLSLLARPPLVYSRRSTTPFIRENERHGQGSEEVEPGNQEAEKIGRREGEVGRRHRLKPNLEDADGIAAEAEISPSGRRAAGGQLRYPAAQRVSRWHRYRASFDTL